MSRKFLRFEKEILLGKNSGSIKVIFL